MSFRSSIDLRLFFKWHQFLFSVLIEGVKYNAEKPNMIGKTFLRLERDFDKHVTYCRDEPEAQDFLAQHVDVRQYFEVSLLAGLEYL